MWHLWFNNKWINVDSYRFDITNGMVSLILTLRNKELSDIEHSLTEPKFHDFTLDGRDIYEGYGYILTTMDADFEHSCSYAWLVVVGKYYMNGEEFESFNRVLSA
jgi:hypothetical protein